MHLTLACSTFHLAFPLRSNVKDSKVKDDNRYGRRAAPDVTPHFIQ